MDDDRLLEEIRDLFGDIEPSDDDRSVAWSRLQEAMAAERRRRGAVRRWRPVAVGLASALVVAVLVLVIQLPRPGPAAAALGEMARVVEASDATEIPAQHFAYMRSETVNLVVHPPEAFPGRSASLAVLLPQTYEMWVGSDGAQQIRTTTGIPVFFSSADEAAYQAAGLDAVDGVGESSTWVTAGGDSELEQRSWPTDPGALDDALRESIPPDSERPEDVDVLDAALDLIRLPHTPPPLRAATLRVVAGLGLDIEAPRDDGGGTFTVHYDAPVETQLSMTIDGAGRLLHESTTLVSGNPELGIPPGTVTSGAAYQLPEVVESLDEP